MLYYFLIINNKKMGNSKLIQLKPHLDKNKNISFGGKIEEEMIQKFNAFDILWYSPENSEKLEEWVAFTNVEVIKITNEESLIERLNIGHQYLIIIMAGSFAEKAVPKMSEIKLLPNIIIYCKNVDYHKKWSEKYEIIGGVFDHPSQIFEYLLNYQKCGYYGYEVPLFNYKITAKKEFNFNYYLCYNKKETLVNQNNFSLKLNEYEKFLVYSLSFFKRAKTKFDDYFIFLGSTLNLRNLFYEESNDNSPSISNFESKIKVNDKPSQGLIDFFTVLTLISFYFSKFPFLYGYLNYEEIEKKLSEEITLDNLRNNYNFLMTFDLFFLYTKLNEENNSILEEDAFLHNLQSFLIDFLVFAMFKKSCPQYPTLIKYLMDLDFCLKIFFECIYRFSYFKNEALKLKINSAINEVDGKRLNIFLVYCNMNLLKETALSFISQENFNILNETLKITDFIILGDEKFYNKIKKIENFTKKKIPYLSISQIKEFLEFKKNTKFRKFTYFLITTADVAQNMFKEIYSIKNDFALYLILIIYIDDKKNTLVNKIPFQERESLPIFIANNVDEIINYAKSQENLNCGLNFINISHDIMNKFQINNKIGFLKDENEDSEKIDITVEDGWELVENIPEDYFQKLIYLGEEGEKDVFLAPDLLRSNTLSIFKKNKIESLFYDIYCKYFNFNLYPELEYSTNEVNIPIKQFCYAYTLDGKDSFYYKMNKELRFGDPSLIEKYLRFIIMINIGVRDKYVKSYKGQVFRATFIKKEIIDKKFIVGKNLINLCFWSSSKSLKKAENYLADPFRNVLFLIETMGNNIDLDEEQISKFEDEKEVLFLPFSKFLIIKKEKKIFRDKEIYEIEIKGMDNEHERGKIKSTFVPSEFIEKLYD